MRDVSRCVANGLSLWRRLLTSSCAAVVFCTGMAGCGDGRDREGDVVQLAVGTQLVDDGEALRAMILRRVRGAWKPVGANLAGLERLTAVVFASPTIAWADGSGLVRSSDGGETWEDVTNKLPAEVLNGFYVLGPLAFVDAARGYLGTYRVTPDGFPLGAPFVWVTRDGGETWNLVDDVPVLPGEIGFTIDVRAGIAEILRHPTTGAFGAIIAPLDGAPFEPQTVATSPAVFRNGFSAVGRRGWAAFSVGIGTDVVRMHPTILTSAEPGAPWTMQTLPDVSGQDFGPIDMCDASVGLAGGTRIAPDIAPVILTTRNGGNVWENAAVDGFEGFTLSDVRCVSAHEMCAALTNIDVFEGAFVVSRDGGGTFERVAYPGSDRSQIFGLASNR